MRQVIRHGRVELALRHSGVREPGRPHVLLLHALFGRGDDWADLESAWPGSFTALDFSGHGESDWLPGRGYSPELLTADADAALAEIASDGPVHIAGAGVGAYAALLLAGARRDVVPGALLLPGPGFEGGGSAPSDIGPHDDAAWLEGISAPDREPGAPGPDPLVESCARDVRPVDYAVEFARAAPPLLVPAPDSTLHPTPAWLATTKQHGDVRPAPEDPREALAALALL